MVEEGLLYTPQHEWARVQNDTAIIGITDHAQEMLSELTFVELPAVGQQYQQNGELAVVESSKAASDVYAPLTGKVIEINNELEAKPELINNDCYHTGWICKMRITDSTSVKNLMDAKQYEEYLKGV